MAWNDEAIIECQLSFKCPRTWGQLAPTNIQGVRHCSECDRDVHLLLALETKDWQSPEGIWFYLRVPRQKKLEVEGKEVYAVGRKEVSHEIMTFLKAPKGN